MLFLRMVTGSGNLRKLLGILHMNIREGDKLHLQISGRMKKWPIRNCRHLCHRIYNGLSFIEDRRWEREGGKGLPAADRQGIKPAVRMAGSLFI